MNQVFAVDIKTVFPPAQTFDTFGALTSVIIKNAFVLAGILSFVLLVVGGFGIVASAGSGDAKKLEQSKKTLTAAVVGLLLVVTSVFIVQLLATITGAEVLKKMIGV